MKIIFPVLAALTLVPASPLFACEAKLEPQSTSLNLAPAGGIGSDAEDRLVLTLRNVGPSNCDLRVAINQDAAFNNPEFPEIAAAGPNGPIVVSALSGQPAFDGSNGFSVILAAGASTDVEIRAATDVQWGDRSGVFNGFWTIALFDQSGAGFVDSFDANIAINIPDETSIRFAGDVRRLDLGTISRTQPTVSPPYSARILSTSPYRLTMTSANRGRMIRAGGGDFIEYEMNVDGQIVPLDGAGYAKEISSHTESTGDFYPISVRVQPDPSRLAGDYSDRVTLSVTAL